MQTQPLPEVFTREQIFYSTSRVGNDPRRLNARYAHFLEPVHEHIQGARVLDLACHNGRWSYALLQMGAAQVTGVEHNSALVAAAQQALAKECTEGRFHIECGDIIEFLKGCQPGQFDVVLCLGILYHTLRASEILHLCRRLDPKLLIVDSTIVRLETPEVLRLGVCAPPAFLHHLDLAAEEGAFAVLGRTHDGCWELLPSARLLEVWIEDAGFRAERVAFANGRYDRGMNDYEAGLRMSFHCWPQQPREPRFAKPDEQNSGGQA